MKSTYHVGSIETDDIILAEQGHLVGMVKYHYPDNEVREIEMDRFPELDEDICYYLLKLKDDKEMQGTIRYLDEQGFSCIRIMEAGHMGSFNFDIYRIKKAPTYEE